MAPLTLHLVVGERVYPHIAQPGHSLPVYGAFLLGCVLVDVNGFGQNIKRSTTHFCENLDVNDDSPLQSCANFLSQLNGLLVRPWGRLTDIDRAFVAGYFCHLAADESWWQFLHEIISRTGIRLWKDLPVPGLVIQTAFDILSNEQYIDFPTVRSALSTASIPDVFTHVPLGAFQAMCDIARALFMEHTTIESVLEMFGRLGESEAELKVDRHQLETYWEDAVEVIHTYSGGVETRVQAMVQRSLDTMPCLGECVRQSLDSWII